MYKRFLVLLIFAITTFELSAQQKFFTISETVLKAGTDLAPKTLKGLNWVPNTDKFSYNDKKEGLDALWVGEVKNAKTDTLLSLATLNRSFYAVQKDSLRRFPQIEWIDNDRFLFLHKSKYVIYSMKNHSTQIVNEVPENAEQVDMLKKDISLAYTIDNNLFIRLSNGNEIQVSNEKNKEIVFGFAAHRNEFGIEKGTFWSPNGQKLAFYRMDQSMVTDYPIIKIGTRPAHDSLIKYPMAGMKSHHATIGVFDIKSKTTIYLKTTGDPEQYLTNISWSPDEKFIYVAVLNRDQNHLWLNKYDANTGDFIKTLFEEKNDKYVEPLDPLIFINDNPSRFLWLSQRDGYKHFYLYDNEGKFLGQITKGDWVVTSYLGTDKAGKNIFYTSTQANVCENNIYKVAIKANATPLRISKDKGYHYAYLNTDATYIMDRYSNLDVPNEIVIADAKGKQVRKVLTAENPLKSYSMGETEVFSMKAADKTTDLWARIIRPPGFDATKKYPVIVYVYGGPHVQLVKNAWLGGSNLWMQYLAQHGYIVFTIDNRGTWNRGQKFESATFENLGTVEIEDQLVGLNYLKSLPYVDTARLGVHGWSFGGFMTSSLMLRTPGAFKVGVAGGPVIDWKYYEIMYTERYMNSPQQNPQGYKKADLLNYVKNLKGRLLLIHGTSDDVVLWQHSLLFLEKSVEEGVQVDYFVYPGHKHNVIGPDRVHLLEKITKYFDDYLK